MVCKRVNKPVQAFRVERVEKEGLTDQEEDDRGARGRKQDGRDETFQEGQWWKEQ